MKESMENSESYFKAELDTEMINNYKGESDYFKCIDTQELALDACWSYKVLQICVETVSTEKVVLSIKIAGVQIGKFTLNKANACIKIKENVGGDAARVDVDICVDFEKREIRAWGKICLLFVCYKFNQRILKW